MTSINDLLEDRSLLNEDTLPILRDTIRKYPFYQAARILYVENLFRLHSPQFTDEIRHASILVPDRTALFQIAEGANYQFDSIGTHHQHDILTEEDASNRASSIIESFLQTDANSGPSIADLTYDYASFLEKSEQEDAEKSPQLKGANLIDSFINETKDKQRFEMQFSPDEYPLEEFSSPNISSEEEEIYTESMVNIYIKQGRYEQALQILRKICTNNPKKTTNFAAQIQLLEIILQQTK